MRLVLLPLLALHLTAAGCFVDEGADGSTGTSSTGSSSTTEPEDPTGDPMCGDGVLAGSELCDDGPLNTLYGACGPVCLFNFCGDGFPGPNDLCDDGNDDETDACLSDCRPASCGDGWVQVGELCDDGNQNNNDGCTILCSTASCGDGVISEGEECDHGERNADSGHCTSACLNRECGDTIVQPGEACEPPGVGTCSATCGWTTCGDLILDPGEACDGGDACTNFCTPLQCGDGHLHAGEACDDGNGVDGDDCTADCELSVCGDGVVARDELCDDNNMVVGDGCDISCERDAYFVFVTSKTYQGGTLGGLKGADARCQELAAKAGLPGEYRAWLSEGVLSPATRFSKGPLPYILPPNAQGDSELVAASWAELVDGELERPIQVTELGTKIAIGASCEAPEVLAWTRTGPTAGPQDTGTDCGAWNTGGTGSAGIVNRSDTDWTAGCEAIPCTRALHLYCFEQAP